MSKLRSTTKQSISNTLENSYFTENNFEVKYHEGKSEFLEVEFIPQPEFKFKAGKNTGYNKRSQWITSEAPGIHLSEAESFDINNFDSIIEHIGSWADRILEDYRIGKKESIGEFDDFERQVEAKVEETNSNKSETFSAEEAHDLKRMLDSLYEKFELLSEENKKLKEQLSSIKVEIENIKGDVDYFPKNAWYRVSGSKIVKMMKKVASTPEGRKLIAETAKKYLIGV
ncbi:hypothetical protein GNP79_19245 [Aliivibrio fischeri]|uniref:Uncharacterized protein n=1 Tax=Aliivibrio fischeri TaxID=668 RepID=A0A6N3Z863_ALIFS|nr:hypothetical protein [Aliivibrio fischeri]MUK45873.1 hypothetical protein [Aliivibrio fischeri]MUK82920.1 hypothetical protein [Aliivibrio fischeri]MUK86650.1 hypothetical protein [Aliivibrio fischeri]